ncbi:hypothetical protein D3C83_292330 [compost metagenome]
MLPDEPIRGIVEVTAQIDLSRDATALSPGDRYGQITATQGDLGLRLTIDQIAR